MLSDRIRQAKDSYINTMPHISIDRARIWTESHQRTEGMATPIRRAMAFKDTCEELGVYIFEGELIVGALGEYRKCGILTPEFSWTWVDREMDRFAERPQDPYAIEPEQKAYLREHIFPYWAGKSLEESFLQQVDPATAKVTVDTSIVDNDSKWRQSVGEITPDYQEVLFVKGFGGIIQEAKTKLEGLSATRAEDLDKMTFYRSIILTAEGIIRLANRYADQAEALAKETSGARREELLTIAANCRRVPEHPPTTFWEALQFVWFTQLGGILAENPLALNPGRFDQYTFPYYEKDVAAGRLTEDWALELIESLWLKMSEWVWTISSNTADFFAGYNQFQNLTVGGKDRQGQDATNAVSYLALKATGELQTHQPGLSVRLHQDAPQAFVDAVTDLVALGTGFPAIHNDEAGYKMLLNNGISPTDARDWNNCGCVVPHFRKVSEWTSAVNLNIPAALEFALTGGKLRLTGEKKGISDKSLPDYASYADLEAAFFAEFDRLVALSVSNTLLAQKLHRDQAPRPFLSATLGACLENGRDLVDCGAEYNVGPVITSMGIAVCANALYAIKHLVFDEKTVSAEDLHQALEADWAGYEVLRQKILNLPKYGNNIDAVDQLAVKIANHQYETINSYTDINGNAFKSAFMGISNYLPTGKILGASPDGRHARAPISEGVSPYAGTDQSTPLAAMRSAAKLNQDVHSGGTLMNLRMSPSLVSSPRGRANLGHMIKSFFNLGGFHVQFNTVSNETLYAAQKNPENYRDLLVRVAGYSTQFVNLSRSMQDAIIDRNSHDRF